MNEIINIESKGIKVKIGKVEFKAYEMIKERAINLSENLKQVEVTEENIKESKKILADVNKDIKKLEDRRVAIKKEMLEPYTEFENQVKEIVKIVKEADEIVRQQVKELENREREEKKELIFNMFIEKINHYDFRTLIKFEDFFEDRMCNKTISINKLEIELNNWLQQRETDFKVIKNMNDVNNEILKEYLNTFNLSNALEIVNIKNEENEKIETAIKTMNEDKKNKKFIFVISNEKDAKLTEMLLRENKIEYKMEEK